MKWISVKEQLPKNNERVIVWSSYDPSDGSLDYQKGMILTHFSYGDESIEYLEDRPGYRLVHWDAMKPNWNLKYGWTSMFRMKNVTK